MRRVVIAATMLAIAAPATPAVAKSNPVLTTGVKSPAVKIVQKALGVQTTGYFGPQTRKAVKAYQSSHGLPVTGIVGPQTWALLRSTTTPTPARPAKPTKPTKPTKPATPVKPTKPTKPATPAKPIKPTKPAKPAKPATPVKPTKPAKPATPAKPAKPATPAKPAKPTKPVKPATPAKPAKPTKPTKPATPVKPTKPAKPVKPVKKPAAAPTPVFMTRTFQLGARGKAVLYLQQKLAVQPQTGYFGPITQAYVKALQAAAKLPVTGIVDPATWKRVGKVKFTAPVVPSTSTSSSPLPTASNATAAKVLQIAKSLAGIPYVATGYSPSEGFNCSSYTQYVYKQVGIDLGGAYTVWQYNKSKHISASQALPGDLVFFYNYKDNFIGHVGIYAGNGMIWHAPHTGTVVKLEKIWTDKVYYGRVLNQ